VVSQCANPDCGAPFLYLRGGRVFAVARGEKHADVEYFWLCPSCYSAMDLEFCGHGDEPILIPRQDPARRNPAFTSEVRFTHHL
jgi:hypothetical protein